MQREVCMTLPASDSIYNFLSNFLTSILDWNSYFTIELETYSAKVKRTLRTFHVL